MKLKIDKEMLVFDIKSFGVIIVISFAIWFFASKVPKCSSSTSHYNSDGFNEVTGEYNNPYQGSEQQQRDLELIDRYSH